MSTSLSPEHIVTEPYVYRSLIKSLDSPLDRLIVIAGKGASGKSFISSELITYLETYQIKFRRYADIISFDKFVSLSKEEHYNTIILETLNLDDYKSHIEYVKNQGYECIILYTKPVDFNNPATMSKN